MISNGCGATVECSVPGRVRFRFPRDKRRSDTMEEAAAVLRGVNGVLEIAENVGTGSLLVLNDPEVVGVEELVDVARDARIVTQPAAAALETVASPGTSQVARSIMDGFKRFDELVSRLSRGTLDGKMLIIFLIFGVAIARALTGRKQTPAPWYALLWYAYSAFMHWHQPE